MGGGLVKKAPLKEEPDSTNNDLAVGEKSAKPNQPKKPFKPRRSEKEALEDSIGDTIDSWSTEDSVIPEDEPFSVEKLPLGEVRLDPQNHRTRHINEFNPQEISLDPEHPDYDETVELVEGLKVFAEHLKYQPMQSPIKVYKHKNRYWTGPGSRRWLASRIAFGDKALMKMHVYQSRPANLAISRFVENNQREDTSLYVRILDLRIAMEECKNQGVTLGKDMANMCGVSTASFSKLSRISNDTIVMDHFVSTRRVSAINLAAKLVGCESVEKAEELYQKLTFRGKGEQAKARPAKKTAGRKREFVKMKPFKDMRLARALISGDVFKHVTWEDGDLENPDAFQEKLDLCIRNFFEELKN